MIAYLTAAILGALVGLLGLLPGCYGTATDWIWKTPNLHIPPDQYSATLDLLVKARALMFWQSLTEQSFQSMTSCIALGLLCVFVWNRTKALWRSRVGNRYRLDGEECRSRYQSQFTKFATCALMLQFAVLLLTFFMKPVYFDPIFQHSIMRCLFMGIWMLEATGFYLLFHLTNCWLWEVITAKKVSGLVFAAPAFLVVFVLPVTMFPMIGPGKIGFPTLEREQRYMWSPYAPTPWVHYQMDQATYDRLTDPKLGAHCEFQKVGSGESHFMCGANFGPYDSHLRQRIEANWHPNGGDHRAILVRFKTYADGRVEDVTVMESAADPDETAAAIRAIRTAAPFGPFPGYEQRPHEQTYYFNVDKKKADQIRQLSREIYELLSPIEDWSGYHRIPQVEEQRRLASAERTLNELLPLAEAAYGPNFPELEQALSLREQVSYLQRRYGEAEKAVLRRIDILKGAPLLYDWYYRSAPVARAYRELAKILCRQEKLKAAHDAFRTFQHLRTECHVVDCPVEQREWREFEIYCAQDKRRDGLYSESP